MHELHVETEPSQTSLSSLRPFRSLSMRTTADTDLERLVLSQTSAVDTVMRDSSNGLGKLIQYLRQRVELEEGYQNSLDKIINNLEPSTCDTYAKTGIHQAFMAHVDVDVQQRAARAEYIQIMKAQLRRLAELKDKEDKSRRLHRKNMKHVAQQYLRTRLRDLPTAQDAYDRKCQEVERMQAVPPTPVTPTTPVSSSIKSVDDATQAAALPSPAPKRKDSQDDGSPPQTASSSSSNVSGAAPVVAARKASVDIPATPMTPTTAHRKFERFMKQFSHLGNQDPTRSTAKVARLKTEAVEADKHYRKIVSKLSTLRIRQSAANEYAMKTMRAHLEENSSMAKEAAQTIIKAEAEKLRDIQQRLSRAEELLTAIDPSRDVEIYDAMVDSAKHPSPDPVYYRNFQAGECQYMLFGISLMDYAHQYRRSPPLLISKCIECIEQQNGLAKQGIYRVSGKQTNIDKLKLCFERDEPDVVPGQNDVPSDVYSVASLIKIFLRELSSPLFPFKLSDRITYSQIPDKELRLMNLLTRILKLPPPHYDTLKAVVEHLSRLVALSDQNKMTIQNVTLIFTPAMFQDHNQAQRSPGEWYNDCVIEDLITNCDTLFADKDLHSASAITGVIDYGFEHLYEENEDDHFFDFDSPSTTSTFSILEQQTTSDEEPKQTDSGHAETTTTIHQQPHSPDSDPSDEKQKLRKMHGLTVDTTKPLPAAEDATAAHDVPSATISSATLPKSSVWVSQDPSERQAAERPPRPLQRSATVGSTLKRSTKSSSSRKRHSKEASE